MKGWKTILIMALVAVAGWLQELSGMLKLCETDPTTNVELCAAGIPGWIVGVIGIIGMGLRMITSTPVFTKK